MYNLNNDEIMMVDGGGDGANLIRNGVKWVVGNVIWTELTKERQYSNGNGNRYGTNQTYGGNGLDTGGCMMQGGGCRR